MSYFPEDAPRYWRDVCNNCRSSNSCLPSTTFLTVPWNKLLSNTYRCTRSVVIPEVAVEVAVARTSRFAAIRPGAQRCGTELFLHVSPARALFADT